MTEIYVSNIPYSSTETDVKSLLERWFGKGAVISCEIKQDPVELQHKGYGFVRFVEQEMADILVCLGKEIDHEFVLQNRHLRFDFSSRGSTSRVEDNGIQVEAGVLSLGCLAGGTLHVFWVSDLGVRLEYDIQNHRLSFFVKVDRDSRLRQYKLEFLFKHIYEMSLAFTSRGGTASALLLELWNPPRVYKRMDEIDIWQQEDPGCSELTNLMQVLLSDSASQDRWIRTIDFTPCSSIGDSLAYVVQFPTIEQSVLNGILHELRSHIMITRRPKQLKLELRQTPLSAQLLVPILRSPCAYHLPFKVLFKLNYIVQVGSLRCPLLSDEFYRLLSQTPAENALWVMQELLHSEKMIDDPVKWFKQELEKNQIEARRFPNSTSINLEEGLIWVYRLLITPTKVYCMGPEVEMSNRVTRHYANLLDNFIRVSFVEEDWETLPQTALCLTNLEGFTSGFQAGRSDIHDRILKVLKDGFFLGGKNYEFLAFSSSQLREQSVWMFSSHSSVTAESIRSWMGDFLEIRNVAKCAARMGQSFASSTKTLAVYPNEVEHLSDILAGGYCFSDGIGQISQSFANTVAQRCGCKRKISRRPPSAFQIRYGGYKGVVAVNPESQCKLSLRPSMKKFESNHYYLEIIGWTRPLPCYLNRQVIVLLSTLGVQDSVFQQMQHDIVSKLDQVLENDQVAMEVLQATNTGATHTVIIEMLNSGYKPQSEPYLMGLLQAFRAAQLARVRSKARILVPKGRCLMGCLDETGTLAYGEVFLQVSSILGSHYCMDDGVQAFSLYPNIHLDETYVVTGPVVVAKNPCLHPGDIRVLRAVDVLQLRHMVDCVVFPRRGHRPHANECSGSDLDGDLYFVSWDPFLIPPTTDSPMNYSPVKAVTLNRRVTIEDIQEFFVQYMINDSLGLIANAHTVLADKEDDMARNPKCLELARLFSVAVDFPKTGEAAVIPKELRPQKYPDFMAKDTRRTYESDKILGKLHRSLLGETIMHIPRTAITNADVVKSFDEELILEGYSFQCYLDEAWNLKKCYDKKLLGLMDQYGIKTEMEAISGNITTLSKYFVKQQGEVKQRIRLAVSSLQKEARSWFRNGYESSDGYQIDESIELTEWEKLAKASAWYYVAYHADYVNRERIAIGREENVPLISFPWTVYDTLLTIKKSRRHVY